MLINEQTVRYRPEADNLGHLSNRELITNVISVGLPSHKAECLVEKILDAYDDDLIKLCRAEIIELEAIGVPRKRAVALLSAIEYGRRRFYWTVDRPIIIRESRDIVDVFWPKMADLNHEEFWVAALNRTNSPIRLFKLSSGARAGVLVDSVLIARELILCKALTFIVSHNHPSNRCSPSKADYKVTEQLKMLGQAIDIKLLDHVIVTQHKEHYYSFADCGDL